MPEGVQAVQLSASVFFWIALAFLAADAVPVRPYEIERAGRTADDTPSLCALEDFDGWRAECEDAFATLSRSPSNLLFGVGAARVSYRATGRNPVVRIRPPRPVPVPGPFDTVSLWVFGNVSPAHRPDPSTPVTDIAAEFADAEGRPFSLPLAHNNHRGWFKEYRRLSQKEAWRVRHGGTFLGFVLTKGKNRQERFLDLNAFSVFKDMHAPLSFPVRPRRGVQVFPGQPQGVNTGEGRLPFPDRESTVIPSPEKEDPRLEFRFPSDPCRWDDLAFRWKKGRWVRLACGGGVFPASSSARTRFRRVGNSVVAEVSAPAGDVEEVRFGAINGLDRMEFVPVPYYTYKPHLGTLRARPGVVVGRSGDESLFVSETSDWTQSSASELFGDKFMTNGLFGANGGARYLPKTDGARNGCFERFVWSVSSAFAEVLPVIPNPPSPWKAVTGGSTWCVHPASRDRAKDVAYWRARHAEGLKRLIVTDHESGWRDGFESFTFRTDPAPAKGGDKGQYDYARIMIDELGYRYGPYNSFCEFAPVNAMWNGDFVVIGPDGQFKRSWERCYAPKPAWIPSVCERLTGEIQRKFSFNTAYCDVHTCISPWSRTDYDARVPGAGTFAQTFYSYGEIMLMQKRRWNGPVYSEGTMHWMYAGLADGNYAQDPEYRIYENPWLVDFDLLRIHPLETDFGMGVMQSFPAPESRKEPARMICDRFLAATLAFGHSSFLVWSPGGGGLRRCDALVRPIAAKYAVADAVSIRYADASGAWHGTSSAIANGAFRRSQVRVMYTDGTEVTVNGHRRDDLVVDVCGGTVVLPPNGWFALSGDGAVLSFSGRMYGKRAEYGISPDGVYSERDGKCAFTERLRPIAEVLKEIFSAQRAPDRNPANGGVREMPLPVMFTAGGSVRYGDLWALWSSGGEKKRAMFMQPSSAGGVTVPPFAAYRLDLPDAPMRFVCLVGKCDGSFKGDGVTCRVVVEGMDGSRTVVAERHLAEYGWRPMAADLSRWAGKSIFLRLETSPGPKGDHSGDWALWAEMSIAMERNGETP